MVDTHIVEANSKMRILSERLDENTKTTNAVKVDTTTILNRFDFMKILAGVVKWIIVTGSALAVGIAATVAILGKHT